MAHSAMAATDRAPARTAYEMIDDLAPSQRRRLAEAIKAERRRLRFRRDSDRWKLSEGILRRVDEGSDTK
jgi:hypothetical protein